MCKQGFHLMEVLEANWHDSVEASEGLRRKESNESAIFDDSSLKLSEEKVKLALLATASTSRQDSIIKFSSQQSQQNDVVQQMKLRALPTV